MNPSEHARAIDAAYAAGYWLLQSCQPHEAVHVFRTILLAAPSDERGWLGLAEAHDALGEQHKALELYRLAPAATGPRARISLALARALARLGEDASDAYESAADIASTESDDELFTIIQQERERS
jgi:predicted Zn-dependent protease